MQLRMLSPAVFYNINFNHNHGGLLLKTWIIEKWQSLAIQSSYYNDFYSQLLEQNQFISILFSFPEQLYLALQMPEEKKKILFRDPKIVGGGGGGIWYYVTTFQIVGGGGPLRDFPHADDIITLHS